MQHISLADKHAVRGSSDTGFERESVCRDDLVNLYIEAMQSDSFSGVYNATAPNPVRMSELCSSLGSVLGRPSWLPVPDFALQVGFLQPSHVSTHGIALIWILGVGSYFSTRLYSVSLSRPRSHNCTMCVTWYCIVYRREYHSLTPSDCA